ncbi:MAG: glycoside hydrolase family 88 protein [Phocaeicola vulgatus]
MFIWPESRKDQLSRVYAYSFLQTYHHLYDWTNHLFFRDDSYFGKQEANGTKVFWGRGNGWVLAGIANILN